MILGTEPMDLLLYHPGLEGIIAGETNISCIEGEFVYRGFPVSDLVDGASFLEVAHLLLTEELPTQEQLADFRSLLWEEAVLPEVVQRFLDDLPLHVGPMAMLRSGVSLLGNCDPQLGEPVLQAGVSQSIRLMARVPLLLGEWRRLRDGSAAIDPMALFSYSGHLLFQLTGCEPTTQAERAFRAALILAADFAFNPPTYAARLAASTGADLPSAVTAAISPLVSEGAARRYTTVLDVLDAVGDPANAERWVRYRTGESLPLPGFEEPGEAAGDPRAALLEPYCRELARETGRHRDDAIAEAVEHAMWAAARRTPTLEWVAARLFDRLGIDRDLHLAAFACGRLVGWCAHVIEQTESEESIRPRSRYRGAEGQVFEPLLLRG